MPTTASSNPKMVIRQVNGIDVGEPLIRYGLEDVGKHLVGQLPQHPGRAPLPEEQLDDRANLLAREAREQRRDVGGRHAREQTLGARVHAAGQQPAQDACGDL